MVKKITYKNDFARVVIKNPKEHIQKYWMAGNFYETQKNGLLTEIYRREKKGGTFIDIGACIGNHSLFFTQVMKGHVVAFEPQPDNYRHLAENIAENNADVIAFNIALGDSEGLVSMRPLADNNAGMHEVCSGEDFKLATLDSRMHHGFDVMKIDVEGYNLQVLRGAKDTLTNGNGNVYIECDTAKMLTETDELMALYGYARQPIVMNYTATYLYKKMGPG